MGVYRTGWNHLKPYQNRMMIHTIFTIIEEMVKIAPTILLKHIIDNLTQFTPDKINEMIILSLTMLAFFIGLGFLHAQKQLRAHTLFYTIEVYILKKYQERMINLGLDYHEREPLGKRLHILTDGCRDLKEILFLIFGEIFPVIIQIVLSSVMLFYYSWELGITFIVFTPLIFYVNYRYTQIALPMRKKGRAAYRRAVSTFSQTCMNIRTVKEYSCTKKHFREFGSHLTFYLKEIIQRKIHAIRTILQEDGIIATGRFLTLALSVYLVIEGQITTGALVLAFTLSEKVYSHLSRTSGFVIRITEYQGSVEDLFALDQTDDIITRKIDEIPVKGFKQQLEFADVDFYYPGTQKPSLRTVNITIPKHKVLAIVGTSGSGKTTLVKLLMRHYDPNYGHIKVDGKDIREVQLEQYRDLFGVVNQDVELFNKSVTENIGYGKKCNTQAIIHAAKQAYAHDFIMKLPNQYHTLLGERGVKLSGGQKQRIAIARALIRKPAILIFDEATSSLDSESEQKIQEAIHDLSRHHTMIIIAHRLSTIMRADHLIMMEHGTITAQGTLRDVRKNNPLFRRMLELQNVGALRA